MEGTIWAFIPAVVAIVLALLTKQVYVSLFLGILVGALMYAGGNPLEALFTLYNVMSEKVGANVPIIVFLVVLGILVVLMQKSGGAKAYGNWAGNKIKTKGGALAATAGLGVDRLIMRLGKISPAEAMVCDSIASSGVEVWCDEVNAVEMVILHGLSGELIVFAFDQWHSK